MTRECTVHNGDLGARANSAAAARTADWMHHPLVTPLPRHFTSLHPLCRLVECLAKKKKTRKSFKGLCSSYAPLLTTDDHDDDNASPTNQRTISDITPLVAIIILLLLHPIVCCRHSHGSSLVMANKRQVANSAMVAATV